MAVDILGPASDHAVTTRPARTITRGVADTWFADCSSPSAEDGTLHTADFYNDVLAQLRAAIVSSGITADNADDMLWRAMQTLGARYSVDSGAVNALVAAFTPPVTALGAGGLTLSVKINITNTGAATIAVDGLATKSIKRLDGSALQAGDLIAGMIAFLKFDGTNFQLMNRPAAAWVSGSTDLVARYVGYALSAGSASHIAGGTLVAGGGGTFSPRIGNYDRFTFDTPRGDISYKIFPFLTAVPPEPLPSAGYNVAMFVHVINKTVNYFDITYCQDNGNPNLYTSYGAGSGGQGYGFNVYA